MKLNSIDVNFHSLKPSGQVICLMDGGSTIIYFQPEEALQIYNLACDLLDKRLASHAAKISAPLERPLALAAPEPEYHPFTEVEDDRPF